MLKKFSIPSDLSRVQKASQEALSFLRPLGLDEGRFFDIRLCLEEALVNAIKYGNCENPQLTVEIEVEYNDKALRIQVQDQGCGFKPQDLPDCTQGENRSRGHGRGVYLMRQLMDELRYNDKGNCLEMVKFLPKRETTLKGR